MSIAISRVFELLYDLREHGDRYAINLDDQLHGFVDGLFWAGFITAVQHLAFSRLATSAFLHSGKPFPCAMNAGPLMPASVARDRSIMCKTSHVASMVKPLGKSQAVPACETVQLQPAPAPRNLRLLCLLDSSDAGEHVRSYPAAAMFPLPPCAYRMGRWQATLPPGLEMRETSAVAPSASVLVRLQRCGQAGSVRPGSRTLLIGVAG